MYWSTVWAWTGGKDDVFLDVGEQYSAAVD
jgi:hypothetical protein